MCNWDWENRLPTALLFAKSGLRTLDVDINEELEGTITTSSNWNFIRHNIKYSTDSIQPDNPFRELEGEINLLVPDFIIQDEN